MNRWRCPHCGRWTFDEMGRTCLDCIDEEEEMARGPRTRPGTPEGWTTDDWATPQDLFDQIAAVFGPFDLDAAAKEETAKCPIFYTEAENGLELPWFGKVWINPPYSNPKPWVEKAALVSGPGWNDSGDVTHIVMLLPADVSTAWFHQFVRGHACWEPLRGRPRFLGHDGLPVGSPKGGSILAVYPPSDATCADLLHLADTLVMSGQRKRAA